MATVVVVACGSAEVGCVDCDWAAFWADSEAREALRVLGILKRESGL